MTTKEKRFSKRGRLLVSPVFLFLFLAANLALCAQELPPVVKLDAPFTDSVPPWLKFSTNGTSNFGNLSIQVTPPSSGASELLLTIIFDEQPNGFLRLYRESDNGSETLASNLMEGVSGTNQRTVLIKDLSSVSSVTLTLQAGSAVLPVKRLVFTWTKPLTIQSDVSSRNTIALRGNVTLRDTDVTADFAPVSQQVLDNFVSAPLQETPESLVDGITFVVNLQMVPSHVRLTAEVLAPELGQRFLCRINGQPTADLTPFPPSLKDPGYFTGIQTPYYAGWTPAGIYLPGSLWQKGDNTIELIPVASDGTTTQNSLSLRNTVLELLYPRIAAAIPVTDPTADSTAKTAPSTLKP